MKSCVFAILFLMSYSALGLERISDIEGVPEVAQREHIYTHSSQHEYVQTYGLATCVALVAYNPETTTTILAHLDAGTDFQSFIERDILGKGYKISLLGGEYGRDHNLLDEVFEYFSQRNISVDTYRPSSKEAMSIMVNTEDGSIYSYYETKMNSSWHENKVKNDRIHYGGRRIFRHQDSIGGGDPIPPADENSQNNPFIYIF